MKKKSLKVIAAGRNPISRIQWMAVTRSILMEKHGIAVFGIMALVVTVVFGTPLAGDGRGDAGVKAYPRIIGGEDAQAGAWPWMGVLVSAGGDLYASQMCGAVLIRPNWALTAAHCVDKGVLPSDIEVAFGVHDLKSDEGERYAVKAITIHSSFNPDTMENDIALLELYENCDAETIGLVETGCDIEGTMGTVLGWGCTSSSLQLYPSTLQQVSVPIVSNNECNFQYNQSSCFDNPITETMVCAGYMEGGKDSCIGDSGGPLLVYCDGTWNLAGLVSWGGGCGLPGFYGVYTRVSCFHDFIDSICGDPHNEIYVPHITYAGPVWTDTLQVDNNDADATTYTMRFFNQGKTVFTRTQAINGYGRQVIDLKSTAPEASFGRICYDGSDLRFRLSCGNSASGGLSEFIIDESAGTSLVLYFSDAVDPVDWKGLVLSNPSGDTACLSMIAMGDGRILALADVELGPYSKCVGLHSEWFPDIAVEDLARIKVVSEDRPICGLTVTGNKDSSSMVMLPATPLE